METLAPERRTSSSGLAPMKAASGVPHAEAEAGRELLAHGAEEGGRVVSGAGADDEPRGRARPCSSPPPRSGLWRRLTAASKSPGGRALRISRVRGRVRVEQRQRRLAAQAGEARRQSRRCARRVVPRRDTALSGEEGALAAAAERELRQDQRAGRERGPGRGARRPRGRRRSRRARPGRPRPAARGARRGPRRRLFAGTPRRRRRSGRRRARTPRGRRRARPGRSRGPAAPSRTSGRRPAARRRPPRRDRRRRSRR